MEKDQIVRFFLEKGLSIDPNSLDYFYNNPTDIDSFFEKIQNLPKVPTSITYQFVLTTLGRLNQMEKTPMEKLSVEELSQILIKRYEKLRKLFMNRIDLVNLISINKISRKTSKFSLIVMVKDKDNGNKTLEVEDLTGESTVRAMNDNFDQIISDEIIGLTCEKTDDTIKAVNILWPDIPFRREISKTEEDIYCLFLSNLQLDEDYQKKLKKVEEGIQNINSSNLYIFLLGEISKDEKFLKDFIHDLPKNSQKIMVGRHAYNIENLTCLSSPSFFKVKDKVTLLLSDGETFLFYKNLWSGQKSENIMLNLLKKRHLDPIVKLEKIPFEDQYLIETVPDIFVSGNFDSPGITNYKGTTIISCGSFSSEPVYWILNLRTRENIKVTLS